MQTVISYALVTSAVSCFYVSAETAEQAAADRDAATKVIADALLAAGLKASQVKVLNKTSKVPEKLATAELAQDADGAPVTILDFRNDLSRLVDKSFTPEQQACLAGDTEKAPLTKGKLAGQMRSRNYWQTQRGPKRAKLLDAVAVAMGGKPVSEKGKKKAEKNKGPDKNKNGPKETWREYITKLASSVEADGKRKEPQLVPGAYPEIARLIKQIEGQIWPKQ